MTTMNMKMNGEDFYEEEDNKEEKLLLDDEGH
jgi:hypothetical protein